MSDPPVWVLDVRARLGRGNKVRFPRDSSVLLDLSAALAGESHKVVVLWALELAEEAVATLASDFRRRNIPAPRWSPHTHGPRVT